MKRATIFVTHGPMALANYYGARALAALEALGEVRRNDRDDEISVDALALMARHCDIIVSYRVHPGSAALFAQLPTLVAFCRCAVDVRNVDIDAASAQGVLVTQASAGFVHSVSEWIVGVMIDLSRGITAAATQYHRGEIPVAIIGRELRGATLGIIGFGQIARALTVVALALGMRVTVADPHVVVDRADVAQVSLAELLAQSDVLVCLAVATAETENLMNAAAFALMKSSAIFVNASRGNLVDEAALLHALETGQIAACGLDVGRAPDQMPSLELARHPRVIATPHVGGLTPAAIEHQSLETVAQVREILQGRAPVGALNAADAHRLQARFGSDLQRDQ